MKVYTFLKEQCQSGKMNGSTTFSVSINNKNYLCTLPEALHCFGNYQYVSCERKKDSVRTYKNTYVLSVEPFK